MKKLFALLGSCFAFLFAENIERGFPVSVRLTSGASQKAEYVGSVEDTVRLGGFISDTFTVVKILKDRIASLIDSNGNVLTIEQADSLYAVMHAKPDSTVQDSTVPDSSSHDSTPPVPPIDISGKSLVFPALRRPIDSALAARIQDLQIQILKEQGERPLAVSSADFPQCKDSPCIAKDAETRGAVAVWTLEIQPAKHQDSLDLMLHRFLFSNEAQSSERLTISAKNATSELISKNRFIEWIQKAKGIYQEPPRPKSTKSYIYVQTDPEGANLSKKGEDIICQTPCAFAIHDTGKVEIEAYWDVENTLWANKAIIRPIPGDTAKINLRLKRVKPEIEIRTIPAGAQIYSDIEITPHSRPIGSTPKTLFSGEPGPADLHLWHEGYKDSVIHFHVSATSKTVVEIKLDSLTSPKDIEAQKVFERIQKRIFWGHLALGTALAPAVAGGILLYLSHRDHEKAADLKSELSLPSSGRGENYQKLVKDNHHYADRSKTERYVGTGFLIFASGLFATGIILSF